MKHYEALLTDMDGTLITTNEAWTAALLKAGEILNISFTADVIEQLHGNTLNRVLGSLGYTEEEITRIRTERDLHLPELLGRHARWVPGAEQFLAHLNHAPTSIVTTSRLRDINIVDRQLNVVSKVKQVVSRDDVTPEQCKPHPYPLQLAVERLGIEDKRIIYIGDQQPDRDAAEAAGIDFILLRGSTTPDSLRARREASSFEEVWDMI